MLGQEFREIIPLDPIVTAGEPEGRKLSGADPPQYGGVAYSATFSNKTDRDEFRGPLLGYLMQDDPPYH